MAVQELLVVAAAWCRDGRCFVAQRSAATSYPAHWEFPGGKVDAGETPAAALERELEEELGLRVAVGEQLGSSAGTTPDGRPLRVLLFLVSAAGQEPELREHQAARWCGAEELARLAWVPADVELAALVAARLRDG